MLIPGNLVALGVLGRDRSGIFRFVYDRLDRFFFGACGWAWIVFAESNPVRETHPGAAHRAATQAEGSAVTSAAAGSRNLLFAAAASVQLFGVPA